MRITESQLRRIVRQEILRARPMREMVEVDTDPATLAKAIADELGTDGLGKLFGDLSYGGPNEDRAYRNLIGMMNRFAGTESDSEGVEFLADDVIGELERLNDPSGPTADTEAIGEVLRSMGSSIPRMGDTDKGEMAEVLDEIEAALEEMGVQWDWSGVAEVAEQENYHAVAFYIPRLKD